MTGITNPPLEVGHNWRQTTVTMVARNFLETDNNIFYPRIDFAGNKSGITGMEFPLLNYLIYLVSLLAGYGHWYGRLINLVVSSVGTWFFFKTVRKYFSAEVALYGTIVLLASIWFTYARKIMPDTFSMSLVMAGFYFGTSYLEGGGWRKLILYFILMFAGILSKLPSGFILVLFILFLFDKKTDRKRIFIFSMTSLLFLLPVGWWYFYWVPALVERYGFWHFFMGTNMAQGAREIVLNLDKALANFYDSALKFSGFALFLVGVGMSFFYKNRRLQLILLLGFLSFMVVILKGGATFALHAYYMVPFIPVMALVCGYGISHCGPWFVKTALITVIVVEGVLNQQHDLFLKPAEVQFESLEGTMNKYTGRGDLIVINSGDYPTVMYFAHRKGWIATNSQIHDEHFMKELRSNGCKYVLIMKQLFGTDTGLPYNRIFSNEFYTLYRL
ncbi:MAG: glycosyltransferase family 39 protein [Bacteroidota bacterium]